MTSSQASTFISAMENAEIGTYYFVTDMSTNFYHDGKTALCKLNGDLLVNFRKPQYPAYRTINGAEVMIADLVDIHEARAVGTAEQIKEVASTLGVTLTDEEYAILLDIDKRDVDLVPATGNYIEFVFIPQEEYEKLTDEQKAEYNEAKKFEKSPLPRFKVLGKNHYDMLSDEDKSSYDQIKATYDQKKAVELPVNQAASIN